MDLKEAINILKAQSNPKHYKENVSKFTILVESGQIAFVKAKAIIYRDKKASSNNVDYFTLIKIDNEWKFLNITYTVKPIK